MLNTQYYSSKEKALRFIQMLIEENLDKKSDYYNDIHISQDESQIAVSWSQVYYEFKNDFGEFKFVEPDELIMKECIFPDNHTEYCIDEEDYQERLKQFKEENPDYYADSEDK